MRKPKPPQFKYHPNLYDSDTVVSGSGICQCCGEEVELYVDHMYCTEDVHCICLDCVKNGQAAAMFDGTFVQDAERDGVSDEDKNDELFRRTPGYTSWQGEHWLSCCDDYCAYLGTVGIDDLKRLGIADEVIAEYEARGLYQGVREDLKKSGYMCGYLFRCLHCGARHLWVDCA